MEIGNGNGQSGRNGHFVRAELKLPTVDLHRCKLQAVDVSPRAAMNRCNIGIK